MVIKKVHIVLLVCAILLTLFCGCCNATGRESAGASETDSAGLSVIESTGASNTDSAASEAETEPSGSGKEPMETESTVAVNEETEINTEVAPTSMPETIPTQTETKPIETKPTEPKSTEPKPTEPKPTTPPPTETKHTHNWGAWKQAKAPTCSAKGTETRTCGNCGKTETRELNQLSHNWSNWKQTVAPTCSAKGTEARTCGNCGKTETRELNQLSHNWSNWKQTVAPTCSANGAEARTCGNCGKTETREMERLNHSFTAQTVAPTCTEGGYTVKTCSLCGAKETVDQTAALGHAWVHHDEEGHWQAILTCRCGAQFYTYNDWYLHFKANINTPDEDNHSGYEGHGDWIVDAPAYDVCSRCGITK